MSLLYPDKIKKDVACSLQFIQIGEVDTVNERFQTLIEIKAKWQDNNIPDNSISSHLNPHLIPHSILLCEAFQ